MKSETYKNKAKELKEKRERLKDCPRNAKKIEELKAEEKRFRAKAKEKKAEEDNKKKSGLVNKKLVKKSPKKTTTFTSNTKDALTEVTLKSIKSGEVEDNTYKNSKNNSIRNSYTSRMEGDWSIRVYDSGFSTGKRGKDFLKASSESELLDKIKEYELKDEEDEIRNENEKLKSDLNDLTARINKNFVLISKLKSKILNSSLKDKSILEDSPAPSSTQISFSVMYPNRVRETNAQYKELIAHNNEVVSNQESFINKLQLVVAQIEEESDDKFYSTGYENGNSKTAEERRANDNYKCEKCGRLIVNGSQYICLTIHGTTSQRIPKKLYGGRQYYRTIHSNATYRYHIGCYEK